MVVGFLMFTNITKIQFEDNEYTDAIPAYLCVLMMPLTYSIAEGISFGMISYVLLNLLCGKKEKLTPVVIVLSVLFILKYLFL